MEARQDDRISYPPLLTSRGLRSARQTSVADRDTTISGRDDPPAWYASVSARLEQLLGLEDNWDSYGASRVQQEAAERAARLLGSTMKDTYPVPDIVPTNDGLLQLEWHLPGLDLEVRIAPVDRLRVAFEDRELGEREFEVESNLTPLVDLMSRLARR